MEKQTVANSWAHPYSGLFISFEGMDFCGKTTQFRLLEKKLALLDLQYKITREPGATRVGEKIRNILLDKELLELQPLTELLLFNAARAQLGIETIIPALIRGQIVMSDRYSDTTVAYQQFGRGLSSTEVNSAIDIATQKVMPDITFYFDISVKDMKVRKLARGTADDRFESSHDKFFELVRTGYQYVAKYNPIRVITVDGTKSIESIEKIVTDHVMDHLDRKHMLEAYKPR